jgi:MSHA biogenesis protein MshQ
MALGGTQEFRYGRLALQNAFGSELLDLAVPLQTEYFDAASGSFVTNGADNCSTVANVALDANLDGADGLDAGETCVQDSGDPLTDLSGANACPAAAPAGEAFVEPAAAGSFNLFLQAPGAGNEGIVGITATPDAAWLQFDWDGDGILEPLGDDTITAIATFGIYQGSERIIYMREP